MQRSAFGDRETAAWGNTVTYGETSKHIDVA